MIKRTLLVTLLAITPIKGASECFEDRIAGSIFGAALGDAFGRITEPYYSYKQIVRNYSADGVNSLSGLLDCDLFNDSLLSCTSNTMISAFSCSVFSHARLQSAEEKVVSQCLATGLSEFYGAEYCTWDPEFSRWFKGTHNSYYRSLSSDVSCVQWISQGHEYRVHYGLRHESDAESLSRVWPVAIVYADELSQARYYADYLTTMTHTHPAVRAATAAYVVGLVKLLNGSTIDDAVQHMILEAEKYDRLERRYKRNARKIWSRRHFDPDFIAEDQMLTSDLIRYAVRLAKEGKEPEEVFGFTNKRRDNNRSYRGFLLGYQADEAVAAAVYLLLQHRDNTKALIAAGSLACGNAPLICSLAGALSGAYAGLTSIKQRGFEEEIIALEHTQQFTELSNLVIRSYSRPTKTYDIDDSEKGVAERINHYYTFEPSSSWWSSYKKVGIIGLLIAGGYLLYHRSS